MNQDLINKSIPNVTSTIKDSTEIWKQTLDYILARIKKRYNTVQEMEEDVNKKYTEAMQVNQTNYDRWFENELKPNVSAYDIEILGDSEDVVIEDGNDPIQEDTTLGDDNMNDGDVNDVFNDDMNGNDAK